MNKKKTYIWVTEIWTKEAKVQINILNFDNVIELKL